MKTRVVTATTSERLLRGVTPWLTASLGTDRLAVGDISSLRPYGTLGLSPLPGLSAELSARPSSFYRAEGQYVGGAGGSLSAAYTWTAPDAASPGVAGWTGQATASGPIPLFDGRWLSGRLLLRGREQGRVDSWQASVSTTIRRTHVALDMESGLQANTLMTARVFQALGGRRSGSIQDGSLTASLGASTGGIELAELGGTMRLKQGPLIDVRLRLRRNQDPMLSVGVSLRSAIGFFRARESRGSGAGLFLSADGGLAYGKEAGLAPLTYQGVGRAGVSGRVFYDLDGDGSQGVDEPPVVDADVLVGGRRATTDDEGRFHSWEATPYEGLVVALDSLTVGPEWASSQPEVRLRPSPNLFTSVSLAVHRTREVSGSVMIADSVPRPVAGARVEIVDQNGRVVASERTFSDGVFYIARLRPGAYRLRVAGPGIRSKTTPEAPSFEFDVPATGEGEVTLPALVIGGAARGR